MDNKYLIAARPIHCDVPFSLPKTHRKAGSTASLNNPVRMNGAQQLAPAFHRGRSWNGRGPASRRECEEERKRARLAVQAVEQAVMQGRNWKDRALALFLRGVGVRAKEETIFHEQPAWRSEDAGRLA